MAASQQTLQIFNLQRDDYGVYQCFVARKYSIIIIIIVTIRNCNKLSII